MTCHRALALTVSCIVAFPAAAQTHDHAPTALASTSHLSHGKGEAWNFVKSGLDLTHYRSVLVDNAVVYAGPDAQFENITPAERSQFAGLLTNALRRELAELPGLAPRAARGVLRIRATVLGAEKTTGGVATATHVLPLGLVTNAVKSAAGKRGSLTGSMLLAIEISDATTGELLAAAVRREAPDALDIPATVSTTETMKAAARELAEKLRKRLDQAMHRK